MGLKTRRPTTSINRFRVTVDNSDITKSKPEKKLLQRKNRIDGRNNTGRVTVRWRGGGNKRHYRMIDFKREKIGVPAVVAAIEYDPNRSSRIALLHYADGEKRYIIAPQGLSVGTTVMSGSQAPVKPGNTLPIKDIPIGEMIHNIELKPGKGAAIARSAGASAQLMAKLEKYALLRMPSGEQRRVLITCSATIGVVGNSDHANRVVGKAGASRWKGWQPRVRGVAMNPVDHPHGGGEGKTSGGRHPVTPWGRKTKGKKTRNCKRTDNMIVRRRK
jgi:large subunit ribosomal protein L2